MEAQTQDATDVGQMGDMLRNVLGLQPCPAIVQAAGPVGHWPSQGSQPCLWGSSCACPALVAPVPAPGAPPCLGCRVLRLLVAPKSCGHALVTHPLLAPVLGTGALGSISWGVGAMSGWVLKRLHLPPGCPKGFYGKHCRKKCHCANRGRCHRLYGACLCDPGLYGRFCHLGESLCLLAALS